MNNIEVRRTAKEIVASCVASGLISPPPNPEPLSEIEASRIKRAATKQRWREKKKAILND